MRKYLYNLILMMKRIFLLLVLASGLASCKKDKQTRDLPARHTPLALTRFYYDYNAGPDFYTEEYSYSTQLKLQKMESRAQGISMLASREYFYSNGLLTGVSLNSSTGVKLAEYQYVYAGGCNLQKFLYLEYGNNPQPRLVIEQVYEYNTQGQPVKTTVKNYNTQSDYYIITTFNHGNVAKQITYTLPGNTLKEETVYQYDNKHNPYHKQEWVNTGNPKYYSVNNITRMTTTSAVSGLVMDVVYDYDYNQDDLPVKQYHKLNNKKVLYADFEYKR